MAPSHTRAFTCVAWLDAFSGLRLRLQTVLDLSFYLLTVTLVATVRVGQIKPSSVLLENGACWQHSTPQLQPEQMSDQSE